MKISKHEAKKRKLEQSSLKLKMFCVIFYRISTNDEEDETTYLQANMNTRLKPGDFSCPLVWETDLPLHPRLKEPAVASQSNLGCRGLHVIRGFLNHNAIVNRRNMFAYRDDCKNIFYFKISEIIQATQMISRASSVSSSVFDFGIEDASKQRPDDRIELRVYGISEVGRNIKNDLIAGMIFYARNRTI